MHMHSGVPIYNAVLYKLLRTLQSSQQREIKKGRYPIPNSKEIHLTRENYMTRSTNSCIHACMHASIHQYPSPQAEARENKIHQKAG